MGAVKELSCGISLEELSCGISLEELSCGISLEFSALIPEQMLSPKIEKRRRAPARLDFVICIFTATFSITKRLRVRFGDKLKKLKYLSRLAILKINIKLKNDMKTIDALNKLLGIELFLFPFQDCETMSLQAMGNRVVLPGNRKRVGKSVERMRSYWAGRCALAVAFERLGIEAYIEPAPDYGYLEVFTKDGEKISDLYVNLSHTESIVAAVLAPCPVGVDIELADRDATRVISRVASELEMSLAKKGVFATNGKLLNPNIALWSAKEAAAKAVGLGMKFGLNSFEIHFTKEDIYRVKNDRKGPLFLKNPSVVIESFDPYIVSVCSESEMMPSGRICRRLISSFDLD